MAKKHEETEASLVLKAEQSGGSQGTGVSRRRTSHRLKLTGYVARRKSLAIGITWDTELPGFGLRKRKSGHLTWIVKHRLRGVQRMVTLGSAGVAAGALSAPAARATARRLLITATLADLPTAPEKLKAPLFTEYAEEFWLDYSPHWKPSTRDASRAYIDKRLIPRFGAFTVDAIERADINRWRDSMADRGRGL